MSFPSPLENAPDHIHSLLSDLHHFSLEQESVLSPILGKFTSTDYVHPEVDSDSNAQNSAAAANQRQDFDTLMLDKFIALDEDKCLFTYQLLCSMGSELGERGLNVVEAGTSFGVSTIYLALAVLAVAAGGLGKKGRVIATEKESSKAEKAREYWGACGKEVEDVIELRVGDLLETLKGGLPSGEVDLLLLDIWAPLALPTLKIVQPVLRRGAVVLIDNVISGAKGYSDLMEYLNEPGSGFQNMTLPFTNGFGMSVYLPANGEKKG